MGEAGFDEFELDGTDSAVVHIRGCDAVSACLGVGNGDVGYSVDRECVVERAVIAKDTTVAVGRVFAETDVSDYVE